MSTIPSWVWLVVVGAGALLGLALVGTRRARPRVETVADALSRAGIDVTDLRAVAEPTTDRAVFVGETADGFVRVAALGADGVSRFAARLSRFVVYRHASPPVGPRARHQIEREAAVERAAGTAGAPVPAVVAVHTEGVLAFVVERVPRGRLLARVDSEQLDDARLADVWRALLAVHAAGVVHGKLDAHHIVISAAGQPAILGFEAASFATGSRPRDADAAQLLAALAARVGPDRALRSALAALGAERLGRVLPFLQPALVSGWTHDAFGGRDAADAGLARLRAEGARLLGVEPPELQRIYRVHPRHVVMTVSALVAVATLVGKIGDPGAVWHDVRHADWLLVLLAFVLAMVTDAVFGLTFLANVPDPIPVWPSIELQVAMAFSNLAIPVAADAAIQVRFLQRNGLDLASATAAGGVLSAVSEIAVQVLVFVVALTLAPDRLDFGHIDARRLEIIVAIVILAVGVAAAVLFGVRALRRVVLPPLRRAGRTLGTALRSPTRLLVMLAGNVAAQLLTAGALLACLSAFGHGISLWSVLAINIGVSLVASIVPVPGGGTAVSVLGLAGMFTAIGVPRAASAAAVLTYQIVHGYLPAIPGWFATNDLLRKQLL